MDALGARDGTVYEMRPLQRAMSLVMLPFFLVVGSFVLYGSVKERFVPAIVFASVWIVAAIYQGWYALRRMPTAVVVGDEALRFVTRAGTIAVPWGDLQSVTTPAWDLNRQVWVWRWRGGKVRSWAHFRNAHRLLGSVERHAPEAEVST